MIPFDWFDETFLLHPERCMFWEKEKMLILSDLHLGKSGHFRKEGIAIPQQVYQNDLNRLFSLIQYFSPREVVLVGDLFHSRANKEWEWFSRWRNDVGHIRFTLVKGNHDVLPAGFAERMQLDITDIYTKGHMLFVHNAEDPAETQYPGFGWISGHIHPAVRIPSGARQHTRLPCFHFSANICTLPAFSLFTGNHTIKPKAKDRVFIIADKEIIPV